MGLYHGWDHDKDSHADFVRGGVDEGDFEDLVRHRSKKKKPKRPKKGCPGNDMGPHVYVWVSLFETRTNSWYDEWAKKYEVKVCCGCEKRGSGWRKV